jgi:hypothetical protein
MTMDGFNFNITANASQSTFKPQLPGNEIHEVRFDGIVSEDVQGRKEPDKTFRVLRIKFSNDKGQFEHTIFEPRPEDSKRRENTVVKDGKEQKIPSASNKENMMLLLKHLIDAVLPEVGKKIDKGEVTLGGKDWEQFRNNVVAILNKGIGATVKIKLVKDQEGKVIFPRYFTGINQEGRAYVRNNFIGSNLAFTAYEKSNMNNEAKATPTKVDDEMDFPEVGNLDLDFDVSGL